MYFNETLSYTLPLYKDMENDVFVKCVLKGASHLPYFIQYFESTRTIKVDPLQQRALIDEYEIEVVLKESTGYDSTTYYFNITIEDVPFIPDTYMKISHMAVNASGEVYVEFDQQIANWWNFTIDEELIQLDIESEATDTIPFKWEAVQ